jgi:hypothetical protein
MKPTPKMAAERVSDGLTLQHIVDNRAGLLAELNRRQGIVRDYVRGVARRYATGLYLFGRPGTAKTHTVKAVLDDEVKEGYRYQRGHLTPLGLFEVIRDHAEGLIILDDLVTLFQSDVALQLLLSALEQPAGHDRTRVVRYRRLGSEECVAFRGGIICVSNRELHDGELLGAFKSRVHTLNYDPPDAELGALMLEAVDRGPGGVKPEEATEVAHYLIADMLRLGCRFDLRLFFDKALPDYRQWQDGATESDWRELVTVSVEQHLAAVRHADERPSRADRKADEHAVVREILREQATREARVKAWAERTGKSGRAFYRRLAEKR